MIRLASFFLILQLGNIQPIPTAGTASLEGTVVRVGTREAVEDVRVVLINTEPPDSADPLRQATSPSAFTDAQGKFAFRNLAAGSYRLTFSANGYVRQEYGQRVFPGRGVEIRLVAGQAMKDVVAEVTPTGSISG